MADALVPCSREIVAPGEIENLGPKPGGDFSGPVGGSGIDDDGFVREVRGRLQAGRQLRLFAPYHQAKG